MAKITSKLSAKPKISQLTTNFNVVVIEFKLDPSSSTYEKNKLKSYLFSNLVKYLVNVGPKVSNALKSPIVICLATN